MTGLGSTPSAAALRLRSEFSPIVSVADGNFTRQLTRVSQDDLRSLSTMGSFGSRADFIEVPRQSDPRERLKTVGMVFPRLLALPMSQNPSDQLVLLRKWRHQKITPKLIRTCRTRDIVDIQVRNGRSDPRPMSIDHVGMH